MPRKITPFLWFDNQAEEAANFYVSIFKDSEVLDITRNGASGPGPEGSVLIVSFRLEDQEFAALNGGAHFTFDEAISFVVDCESQAEVDYFWDKLSEGGEPGPCGWLKDKFGLSWQIVPSVLSTLMQDPDPKKTGRVSEAMMEMTKLDITALQRAYDLA